MIETLKPIWEEYKTYFNKANEIYDLNAKAVCEKNILKYCTEVGVLAGTAKLYDLSGKTKADKDDVTEQFAVCVLSLFGFLHQVGAALNKLPAAQQFPVTEQFLFLLNESSFLIYDFSELHIKEVLANLFQVGKFLKLKEDDVLDACYLVLEKISKII